MKKAKKEYWAKDRLSELPESLILDILRFLPLTDVVRTMVLSKHWKNMWTTIPWLDFDFDFDFENSRMKKNKDKFREFVYGALRSWRGSKMLRFNVKFDSKFEKSLTRKDIDRWVRFAVERDVEEMELLSRKLYVIPRCLYTCSSLKQLKLRSWDIAKIDGNVQWHRLKSLTIDGEFVGKKCLNKVLCGSPRLESLSLVLIQSSKKKLNISSSSLKRLEISTIWLQFAEVRISTPNLESLKLSLDSASYCKFLVMNMPSLSEAILHLSCQLPSVVEEMLTQILPVIKHVERFSLSYECIEALGSMKEKRRVSSFPNAYFLEVESVYYGNYEEIVGVLEMFPNLKNLVLEPSCFYGESCFGELEKSVESWNLPNSFLSQLRRVDVITEGDGSIIPLIRILLKYATNLEKMILWEETVVKFSKGLLKIERSSPNEELIFDHTLLISVLSNHEDAA